MFERKQLFTIIVLGMILVLAACAPGGANVPITGETPVQEQPSALPTLPSQAILEAQQWLATQLNAAVDQIRIISLEQMEWTDSCLGLGRLNESCLQAITPGWQAVFEVNGITYEVRTDETGSVVRLAPSQGAAENSLENTHWSLVSFGAPDSEQPPAAGSMITLMLANGQAGGFGGCNSYGGSYQVEGNTVSFDELNSTLVACENQEITDQEQRYFQALDAVASYERSENFLILSDESGNAVLTFETPMTVVPAIMPTPQ